MVDVNKSVLFMAMLLNVNVTLDTDYRQMGNHVKLVRYCDFLVHITTKVEILNPAHGKVYSVQHYVIRILSDLW
jgi:hypothetical protein